MLAQIARSRLDGLPTISSDEGVRIHQKLWHCFVQFIHESCVRDSRKALKIATKSSASRLAARAAIYILRARFEQFQFDILSERDVLSRSGLLSLAERERIASLVSDQKNGAMESLKVIESDYIRSRPCTRMEDLREERKWFAENCKARAMEYMSAYENLEEHVKTDKGYQSLSTTEIKDIVKAFGFCTCMVLFIHLMQSLSQNDFLPSSHRSFLQLCQWAYIRHH
jgi:hypothetical protein